MHHKILRIFLPRKIFDWCLLSKQWLISKELSLTEIVLPRFCFAPVLCFSISVDLIDVLGPGKRHDHPLLLLLTTLHNIVLLLLLSTKLQNIVLLLLLLTTLHNRGERILFFGPNTNTNIIRNQNFDRIRIRIIFVFSEWANTNTNNIRAQIFGRIWIRIIFGFRIVPEYEYE